MKRPRRHAARLPGLPGGPPLRRRGAGPDDRAVVCLRAAPGRGPVSRRREAPQGRPGEPAAGVRRSLYRGRAGSDRPGRLPAFLHDADGDPPHPAQAAPDDLARADHAGRARAGRRPAAEGGADHHAQRPLRQLGDGGLPVRRLRVPPALGRAGPRQPVPRPVPEAVPRADGPADDPEEGGVRPDARRPPGRRRALVPGGPGRRRARDVRRVLRAARLDAQGDRAAGHGASRPGGRRLREAGRAGLPLRGRLRGDHRARRVDRHGRRRPVAHPALHHGPRSDHPPRPRAIPLAPPALEAPAEAEEETHPGAGAGDS